MRIKVVKMFLIFFVVTSCKPASEVNGDSGIQYLLNKNFKNQYGYKDSDTVITESQALELALTYISLEYNQKKNPNDKVPNNVELFNNEIWKVKLLLKKRIYCVYIRKFDGAKLHIYSTHG